MNTFHFYNTKSSNYIREVRIINQNCVLKLENFFLQQCLHHPTEVRNVCLYIARYSFAFLLTTQIPHKNVTLNVVKNVVKREVKKSNRDLLNPLSHSKDKFTEMLNHSFAFIILVLHQVYST